MAANTSFWLNLIFIADSRTSFRSELLSKHELNLRRSNWNSSVKKRVLRNFANFSGKSLCWSLFLIELQALRPAALLKRDSNTDDFLWNLKKFWEDLIWSLPVTASETCSFTWTAFFTNLHFWLNIYFSFCIISYSFVCQYSLCSYWYCYNQKQFSGTVLQNRFSYKCHKIHIKTSKKRFWHGCLLVNSAKFLITPLLRNPWDGCFCINTSTVYCPTMTFRSLKMISHIFSGWVFFQLNL